MNKTEFVAAVAKETKQSAKDVRHVFRVAQQGAQGTQSRNRRGDQDQGLKPRQLQIGQDPQRQIELRPKGRV